MNLTRFRVRNFRCLLDVDFRIDPYTAFIGPNGSGKSTCLYALDWLFNQNDGGHVLTHVGREDEDTVVEITVTDIPLGYRERLGAFGRSGDITLTRTLRPGAKKSVLSSTAWMGPGFAEVRSLTSNPMRTAYRRLQEGIPGLPELPGNFAKELVEDALGAWESAAENRDKLIEVDNVPADSVLIDTGLLAEMISFSLIKGSVDLAREISTGGKGSVFSDLTGALVEDAVGASKNSWLERNEGVLSELRQDTEQSVRRALEGHQRTVNQAISALVADIEVDFSLVDSKVDVRNDIDVLTQVKSSEYGVRDVAREGHGVQRAVMMAMVQSLAEMSGESSGDGPLRIFAFEEPEVYQHPIRIRSFARSLESLAERDNRQVMIATHSPHFVRPSRFDNVRRVTIHKGESQVTHSCLDDIVDTLGSGVSKVKRAMEKNLPTSFSEGFFADCVMLVEGDTDLAVIESVGHKMCGGLDSHGIFVVSAGGKDSLPMCWSIFSSLGVKVYTVLDGDFDDDANKSPGKEKQTSLVLRKIRPQLADGSAATYSYGDETTHFFNMTVLRVDLESELRLWQSCQSELTSLGSWKDAYQYRVASTNAEENDIPDSLGGIVEGVIRFSKSSIDLVGDSI